MFTTNRTVAALTVACLTVPLAVSAQASCVWDRYSAYDFFSSATAADVTRCIKAGTNANGMSTNETPLHFAAWYSDIPAVVTALLDAGADVNARADHFRIWIEKRVDRRPRRLGGGQSLPGHNKGNWFTLHGVTPLHLAAHRDNPAIVKALIDAGADVNAETPPQSVGDGYDTPLHFATEYNDNPAVVTALIDAGADVNARNFASWTPLHKAAWNSVNPAVFTVLLDAGADPAARDRYGEPPVGKLIDRIRLPKTEFWINLVIDLDMSAPTGPWSSVFTRLLDGQR